MGEPGKKLKIGAVLTHPVQYYSPWFAKLAEKCDLKVYYAYRQTPEGQAAAGFKTSFDWDVPLLDGYHWQFLSNVARKPGLQRFRGCDTPEINRILREEQFDALLIFGWNKKCYFQAWYAALRTGTRVFIRLDSQLASQKARILRPVKRFIYSLLLPRFAEYLSPGRRTDEYLRFYSVPENRIHRLAHMVDTDRFSKGALNARKDGSRNTLRERYGASSDTFVFLFVGKLIAIKRPDLLIESFSDLETQNAHLWIVGDGPLRKKLEGIAETVPFKVNFLGFKNQSELPAIYAAADCVVLPSFSETWGLVVNESFACGTPAIVSSGVGCASELIEDGKSGWVIKKLNRKNLSGVLAKAVDDARDLPREVLRRRTAEGSYDVGASRFLEIVLNRRSENLTEKNAI